MVFVWQNNVPPSILITKQEATRISNTGNRRNMFSKKVTQIYTVTNSHITKNMFLKKVTKIEKKS